MGDLVIGARSGAGEPEGPGGRVNRSAESSAPSTAGEDTAAQNADAHGTGADGPPEPQRSESEQVNESDSEAPAKPRKQRSFLKELPILIGIALILALVIKTFFVQAFSIPSESMQNTLQVGDRVLVDKLTPWFGSEPERGDVVVFHDPGGWLNDEPTQQSTNSFVRGVQDVLSFVGLMPSANEKDLIKRVIAVGGDTVECKDDGPVKVNGVALNEPYVYQGNTPCGTQPFGPVKVPNGRIWVMGDHRADSLDSRFHMDQPGGGTVPVDNVIGRAFVVAWPVSHWSTLPVPDTFDQTGLSAVLPAAPPVGGAVGAVALLPLVRRVRTRKERRKES
ncbi:signal peptidase I [Kitasatospora aureofaciens]|uniref:Signal peptidase I n=1 Tax=Kitasatospora aureofaciens TaxID=1894 RepID=A0A1E7N2R3_KITAU|nr:signal peptidase I [Kitasatospora aureofaciens]ARF78533.1 signal peptidase I [Kitasatospora aureofaciens]OEV34966.1 signal peptidase I [Kitasatospora aureofaciens]GGU98729.1 signal peptidase I [Kitasatospora aureofaciens]